MEGSAVNLSARIMNLPVPDAAREWPNYGIGHRDARHAAAELASEADAIRDELVVALEGVLRVADRKTIEFDAARAALARAKGQA